MEPGGGPAGEDIRPHPRLLDERRWKAGFTPAVTRRVLLDTSQSSHGTRRGSRGGGHTSSPAPLSGQVFDHAEADVAGARLDQRPEIVDEAPDHLVGQPLELGVDLW